MHPLQTKILTWYAKQKRDLPWRKTRDPYKILVSEVMLQQTQVDRVISYYTRWLEDFPTIEALAKAKKEEVLTHWSGLGYNSRALRLQQTSQALAGKPFPKTEEELLKLPGIGPYTARAVLAFAFNKEVAVIDTNIRRVLMHELGIEEKEVEKTAQSLIPKGKSRIWHNALMDYGALEKTARKTGIKPRSKQSTFKGSEREVRGNIMKTLLKEKSSSKKALAKLFPHAKFDSIVEKMKKEGIIVEKNSVITL